MLVQSNFLGLGGTKLKEDELPPKVALDLGHHCVLDYLAALRRKWPSAICGLLFGSVDDRSRQLTLNVAHTAMLKAT